MAFIQKNMFTSLPQYIPNSGSRNYFDKMRDDHIIVIKKKYIFTAACQNHYNLL